MGEASIIGIDLAKRSFQVHGARADGSVAYRRKLSRGKLLSFLASQPKCTVAMEACAGAHYWGRQILALGHEVRLVPPVPVPVFGTSGRLKHHAALRLNFSRARAGVRYPWRWRSQLLL